MSEAKGKLYIRMEKRDFNVSAKLTLTGSSYTSAIEVAQTMAQVGTMHCQQRQAVTGGHPGVAARQGRTNAAPAVWGVLPWISPVA